MEVPIFSMSSLAAATGWLGQRLSLTYVPFADPRSVSSTESPPLGEPRVLAGDSLVGERNVRRRIAADDHLVPRQKEAMALRFPPDDDEAGLLLLAFLISWSSVSGSLLNSTVFSSASRGSSVSSGMEEGGAMTRKSGSAGFRRQASSTDQTQTALCRRRCPGNVRRRTGCGRFPSTPAPRLAVGMRPWHRRNVNRLALSARMPLGDAGVVLADFNAE